MTNILEKSILNLDPNVRIVYQQITEEELYFILKVESEQATCPACSNPSNRAHSQYVRSINDLPAGGLSVRLKLIIKKWFCDNGACPSKDFKERLSWMQPYARMTNRLDKAIRKIGFSTNWLTAEKVCQSLGIPVSHDTILRRLKEPIAPPSEVSPFRRNR